MAHPVANAKHKTKLRELRADLEVELASETDPVRREKLQEGIDKITKVEKKGFDPTVIITIITLIVELLKLLKSKT